MDWLIKNLRELPPQKKTKAVDECYQEFVKMWCEAYPDLAIGFNGVAGAKIKSLILKSRTWIGKSKEVTNENVNGMFAYVLAYVKRENHWLHGKDLTTWDSKYLEVIYEIKNGKRNTNQSARSVINAL